MGADSTHDLDRLVRRCQRGDEAAWAQIVRRFQALVYSTARRTGLRQDDAEDVFQTTFLALYRSLDRLEDPQALPKWLAIAAARESLRVLRLRNKFIQENEERGLDEVLEDEASLADEIAEQTVDAVALRTGLSNLGGRCEALLTALYIQDLDYREVQERLQMPVGAIGPTRARCLKKLRDVLQRLGFFREG